MLSWPMIAFGWVTNMLQRGMASWKRMLEVLDARAGDSRRGRRATAVGAAPAARRRRVPRPDVRLRRRAPVLRDVSAHDPGRADRRRSSAPTGSGKSTLISLLPRLHDPPPGTVFVDGVDVRDLPLAVLRGAIGFVPQEPFLFSDTLATTSRSGWTRHRAASAAGATTASAGRQRQTGTSAAHRRRPPSRASTRTSPTFPKGYETMVGERGITLSGGQKQRTAIAARRRRSTRASSSSTTRCRRSTPTPKRRSCRGCAA